MSRLTIACVAFAALVAVVAATISTTGRSTESVMLYNSVDVPKMWKPTKENRADASAKYTVTLGLHRQNLDKMDATFWQVSDPHHEKYGEHLNHEQMTALTSPGKAKVAQVVAWLQAEISVQPSAVSVTRHEDYVVVELTAAQISKLFDVNFHTFQNEKTGAVLSRAVGAVMVPSFIADIVETVSGFRGFPAFNTAQAKKAETKLGSPQTFVTPELLYRAYNLPVSEVPKTPTGKTNIQSFFQAQGQYVESSDLTTFCKNYMNFSSDFDMSKCKIEKYIGPDQNNQPGVESSLDSEYIMAAGFGQETWVYSYSSNDFCADLINWALNVFSEASGTFPNVISMSYGSQSLPPFCDQKDVKRITEDVQKMGTMGISVMIASGDMGSGEQSRAGYNYGLLSNSFPSNIPYCTAVGSTTFIKGNSGEQQGSSQFGSGGGFCYDQARPAYQSSAVNEFFKVQTQQPPALSYNHTTRGTPDVSVLGEGFQVVSGGSTQGVGGTSASTPTFSGFVTLLNNVRLEAGKTLGFLNPLLYQNPQVFNDITAGNNDVDADGYGWYAAKGWDPVTGLGTPNVGKMIDLVRSLNSKKN